MNFFSMRSEDFPELPWKKNISGNIVCLVLSISFFCGWKIVQLDVARLLLFVGSIIETGCTIIQIIQIKAGFLLRKMSPQNGYNKDCYHKGGRGVSPDIWISFLNIFLKAIQKNSWTPKTCFAIGLDFILFISNF